MFKKLIFPAVSRFLASKFSGWLSLGLFTLVGGFLWAFDERGDELKLLKEQCLAKNSPATTELADELVTRYEQDLKELQDQLANTEHACLDWVYDPDAEASRSNPSVRPTTEEK
jgi:hypothetical protein